MSLLLRQSNGPERITLRSGMILGNFVLVVGYVPMSARFVTVQAAKIKLLLINLSVAAAGFGMPVRCQRLLKWLADTIFDQHKRTGITIGFIINLSGGIKNLGRLNVLLAGVAKNTARLALILRLF